MVESPTSAASILSENSAIKSFSELCGRKILNPEIQTLVHKFQSHFTLLKMNQLTKEDAHKLLGLIQITLKSKTIANIAKEKGYLFDGILSSGGGKALLYRVLRPVNGFIYCGKVYLDQSGQKGAYITSGEHETAVFVHGSVPHPNIVCIEETIKFTHINGDANGPGLVALIMPLYPMSLSNILEAYGQGIMPFEFFFSISQGLLSAAARFQERNLSHCDLKPDNVMMNNLQPVVIDFGAVVTLGTEAHECTLYYPLDADKKKVTAQYDLNCIVTTLVRCFHPNLELIERTRESFVEEIHTIISLNKEIEKYANVCLKLLRCTSSKEGLNQIQ